MATESRTGAARAADMLGRLLEWLWIALLYLPAALTFPPVKHWERGEWAMAVTPAWLIVALHLALGRVAFFAVTLPIAFLGVLCLGATTLRGVDLLTLALDWHTFTAAEVRSSVGPYLGLAVAAAVLLTAWAAAAAWLARPRTPGPRERWMALAGTLVAAALVPPAIWPHVWPVDTVLVVAAAPGESRWLAGKLFPRESRSNPRDPGARWNGARDPGAAVAETLVLVIGETVRSDYLRECRGPAKVRAIAADALVACDVTSSSDLTSTSVPLLVSREMPGHAVRVSHDATFLHALKETGFETHWYSTQSTEVAWPDADHQAFMDNAGPDEELLMPRFKAALARPAPLKAIVLHAYGAHDPYCFRFDPRTAPYAALCVTVDVDESPDAATTKNLRLSYANAVDATVGFVNDTIAALRSRPEPVFLLYTADHGEALLDDGRGIHSHALRHPTRWDTQVPAVFWANDAWRATHAAQWARLQAQLGAPLMHADMVPTLLAAADVRYTDARRVPVDLLATPVPPRDRLVQVKLGETVSWRTLVDDAREAGPAAVR